MSFFQAYPVVISFIAILLAEIVKAFLDALNHRSKIRFLKSGGMPSGHSAFVTALVVVVANHEGIKSIAFAIAAVVALIVMYDAVTLRHEAGKHAKILNEIRPNHQLEESLGHTKLQVIVGALFGALVAFILLSVG